MNALPFFCRQAASARIPHLMHQMHLMRRLAAFGLGILLLSNVTISKAGAAESFAVDAERRGDAVQVDVHATVMASSQLVHDTLTDYDHLAEFIPGMRTSRVIERHDNTAIVVQSGFAHFWFLHFPIDVTMETVEPSPSVITVHLLGGNLRQLDGRYDIEQVGHNLCIVHWHGMIEPGTNVPTAIAVPLLRRNIAEQFHGMVKEIERRAALQPDPQHG